MMALGNLESEPPPDLYEEVGRQLGVTPHAYLALPILHGGRAQGVACYINRSGSSPPGPFRQEEMERARQYTVMQGAVLRHLERIWQLDRFGAYDLNVAWASLRRGGARPECRQARRAGPQPPTVGENATKHGSPVAGGPGFLQRPDRFRGPPAQLGAGMTTLDFDELFDLERLRTALAGATGRGVCVAILDTGIDVTHPDLQGAVVRSVEVLGQPQVRVQDLAAGLDARQLDPVGHGTACAGIIHQLAPEAKLISVRVIGAGAAGTGEQFVRGLQWVLTACEPKVQVVNLSLGTMEERYAASLRKLVDQAYADDVVLVAAANNMGATSYPAQFASLIAVDNQGFEDPLMFQYQRGRPIEMVARRHLRAGRRRAAAATSSGPAPVSPARTSAPSSLGCSPSTPGSLLFR